MRIVGDGRYTDVGDVRCRCRNICRHRERCRRPVRVVTVKWCGEERLALADDRSSTVSRWRDFAFRQTFKVAVTFQCSHGCVECCIMRNLEDEVSARPRDVILQEREDSRREVCRARLGFRNVAKVKRYKVVKQLTCSLYHTRRVLLVHHALLHEPYGRRTYQWPRLNFSDRIVGRCLLLQFGCLPHQMFR